MDRKIMSLHGEKLRRLTKLVHEQEVKTLKNINFKSEEERREYLNESQAGYTSALEILNVGEKVKRDYKNDEIQSYVAHRIFSAMEWTINTALQCVRHYTLRENCLREATVYCQSLIQKLHFLDPQDASGVFKLLADAEEYENALVAYANQHSNPVISSFSNMIKNE